MQDLESRPSPCLSGQDIERIYEAYPVRTAKAPALVAIRRALVAVWQRGEDDPVAFLLSATQAYALSPEGLAQRYVPKPATWFDEGRYDDDPAAWTRTPDERGGGGGSGGNGRIHQTTGLSGQAALDQLERQRHERDQQTSARQASGHDPSVSLLRLVGG